MTSVTESTRELRTAPDEPPPRTRRAARAVALLPAAIIAVPLFVVVWSFWPGHMSSDTLAQIGQLKTGDFTNQHAPLLMALWKPLYSLGFGPGFVLAFQGVVFATGCWLLLRTVLRPLAAGTVTAAICFSPPVFGMLGYLSRDVWYTAALLLTFGLAARAIERPDHRRLRIALVLVAAWFALAARQNAAPGIVLALFVVAALLLAGRRPLRRWRHAAAVAGVGIGLCVGLMATQFVAAAALGVRDVHPEQYVMIYDIAGISHRERVNLLPPDVMKRRGIGVIDQYWNVDVVNSYLFTANPPVPTPLSDKAVASLRTAWLDAIADHPAAYLAVRAESEARQLGIGRPAVFIYHPGIDANQYGFWIRHPRANAAARDYVEGFADDNLDGRFPFYVLWLYFLVAIGAGVWLLSRARSQPALAAVGAFGLAALTFQAGLFLGAMGTQYRLEFPMVATSIVTAIVAIVAWRSVRGRSEPAR